jgi:superfamily II DNA or RNA helicase
VVDFKKRIGRKGEGKLQDPTAIYETLDRAYDKGPLRPAQESILKDWHAGFRSRKDLIVKLHTGQGKTLNQAITGSQSRQVSIFVLVSSQLR